MTSKIMPGTKLELLSWIEAEELLASSPLIVIPLGAQLKEHGPHLPLNNDWLMANYFAEKLLELQPIVLTPTVNFNYFPAMVDYPGTVSLSESVSAQLIEEIVLSLAKFGPKNFYVLNTGISTISVLETVQKSLEKHSVSLDYSDLRILFKSVKDKIEEQEGGTHADEIETSIMLSIAPQMVQMEKAQKDFHSNSKGPLRRKKDEQGTYSPTGSFGDPTLASKEKGELVVNAILNGLNKDIQNIFNRIL